MGRPRRKSGAAPVRRGQAHEGWEAPRPRELPGWRRDLLTARRSEAAAASHARTLEAAYGTSPHIIVEDPVAAGRRPQGEARRAERAGADGRRIYTCRWTVKGHTRRQRHGPGNSLTKRIYIEPHLQGPQDAPIKATAPETVRLFDV